MELDIIAARVRELLIAQGNTERRIHDVEISVAKLVGIVDRLAQIEKGRAPLAAVRPTLEPARGRMT